jgi:menaquinone-dependent protoporphyrinogen IX oxidase
MKKLNVAIVYFSGTAVTKSYAEVIHARLKEPGCNAELIDITPYSARREPLPVESFNGIVFGFPVYADFPPRVINEWLPTLKGDGKPYAASMTARKRP